MTNQPAKRRKFIGTVVSDKMNHAVVVKVESVKVHPKYQKRFKVFKKYAAQSTGEYHSGDRVEIEESKPLSKTVHWRVLRKVNS